ncbi:MAG: hypothetical protein WC730_04065 [Patescibacteria group bacterium]|jgi:hypothetical protein
MEPKTKKTVIIVLVAIAGLLLAGAIVMGIGLYLFFSRYGISDINEVASPDSSSAYDHPLLTDDQEAALSAVGIDPSTIPESFSQAQIDCAVTAVGETRANEILAGAEPTFLEVMNVLPCLSE